MLTTTITTLTLKKMKTIYNAFLFALLCIALTASCSKNEFVDINNNTLQKNDTTVSFTATLSIPSLQMQTTIAQKENNTRGLFFNVKDEGKVELELSNTDNDNFPVHLILIPVNSNDRKNRIWHAQTNFKIKDVGYDNIKRVFVPETNITFTSAGMADKWYDDAENNTKEFYLYAFYGISSWDNNNRRLYVNEKDVVAPTHLFKEGDKIELNKDLVVPFVLEDKRRTNPNAPIQTPKGIVVTLEKGQNLNFVLKHKKMSVVPQDIPEFKPVGSVLRVAIANGMNRVQRAGTIVDSRKFFGQPYNFNIKSFIFESDHCSPQAFFDYSPQELANNEQLLNNPFSLKAYSETSTSVIRYTHEFNISGDVPLNHSNQASVEPQYSNYFYMWVCEDTNNDSNQKITYKMADAGKETALYVKLYNKELNIVAQPTVVFNTKEIFENDNAYFIKKELRGELVPKPLDFVPNGLISQNGGASFDVSNNNTPTAFTYEQSENNSGVYRMAQQPFKINSLNGNFDVPTIEQLNSILPNVAFKYRFAVTPKPNIEENNVNINGVNYKKLNSYFYKSQVMNNVTGTQDNAIFALRFVKTPFCTAFLYILDKNNNTLEVYSKHIGSADYQNNVDVTLSYLTTKICPNFSINGQNFVSPMAFFQVLTPNPMSEDDFYDDPNNEDLYYQKILFNNRASVVQKTLSFGSSNMALWAKPSKYSPALNTDEQKQKYGSNAPILIDIRNQKQKQTNNVGFENNTTFFSGSNTWPTTQKAYILPFRSHF